MAMVYSIAPATAGNLTTSATPGTEVETFFLKPGATRAASFSAMSVIGKGAGLTAISGLVFRLGKWATASTAGTAMTPSPRDVGMQAATATAASRPTAGSTRTQLHLFGCGAAGPGGWMARDADDMVLLNAAGALSLFCADACGTASMLFEFSATFQE